MFITRFSVSWVPVGDLVDWFNTIDSKEWFFCESGIIMCMCLFIRITLKLWWWVKYSPSRSSSKSSTKNSRSGGRLGCFSVFTSCWILAETRLLTGTPMKRIQPNKQKQNKYYHSYINQMSWICLNEPINTHTGLSGFKRLAVNRLDGWPNVHNEDVSTPHCCVYFCIKHLNFHLTPNKSILQKLIYTSDRSSQIQPSGASPRDHIKAY